MSLAYKMFNLKLKIQTVRNSYINSFLHSTDVELNYTKSLPYRIKCAINRTILLPYYKFIISVYEKKLVKLEYQLKHETRISSET